MEKVVDIVKHAITNEVRARTFYAKASELSTVGESQMVFIELVEMEDQHARRLVDAFGELLGREGVDAEAYLAEQEADVDRALGEDAVATIAGGEMRPVLDFAIGMEVQARDNYLVLETKVDGAELKTLCRDLAAEEQKHFDLLTEARSGVDTPIDERPAL
jgi:rubrerythrin